MSDSNSTPKRFNSATAFPSLATAMVDQSGRLTPAWYQLFLNLWNRTGGAPGSDIIQIIDDADNASGQDAAFLADDPLSDQGDVPSVLPYGSVFSEGPERNPESDIRDNLYDSGPAVAQDRGQDLLSLILTGQTEELYRQLDALYGAQVSVAEGPSADQDLIPLLFSDDHQSSSSSGADNSSHPGYMSSFFYPTWVGPAVNNATIPSNDVLYLYPIYINSDVTISSLFFQVVALPLGTAQLKFGIWPMVGRRPYGTPVVSNGAGNTISAVGINSVAVATTLKKGWYFVGCKLTGTGGLPMFTSVTGTTLRTSYQIGSASSANALSGGANDGQMTGLSTPSVFSAAMPDLTSATLTAVMGPAGTPIIGFGVA